VVVIRNGTGNPLQITGNGQSMSDSDPGKGWEALADADAIGTVIIPNNSSQVPEDNRHYISQTGALLM
jgi:hypothetical protein